jgi:hypothetical protein
LVAGYESVKERTMNENIEAKEDYRSDRRGHFLDLKLPIGWLLSAYGLLLGAYGLLTKKELYRKSLGLNLNLAWGVLMLLIGAGFLLAAFLKRDRQKDGLKK